MDIKSEYVLSVQFVTTPVCIEIIRNAFATAVFHYGRPKAFLTDNGRDYLKRDLRRRLSSRPTLTAQNVTSIPSCASSALSTILQPNTMDASNTWSVFSKSSQNIRKSRAAMSATNPKTGRRRLPYGKKERNRPYLWNKDEACKFIGAMIDLYHRTPSKKEQVSQWAFPGAGFCAGAPLQAR